MTKKCLVGYATKYGSTREVAEAIAATLREAGLTVDFRPMREVSTLDEYEAVVLGAPLYIGKWPKDAHRFLARHHEALMQRAVAAFALGPIGTDEQEKQGARTQLDAQLARYAWLTPVAVEVFVGRYDPHKLRFPDSLLAGLRASPLHGVPTTDNRDWAAIRAWAGDLAAKLG